MICVSAVCLLIMVATGMAVGLVLAPNRTDKSPTVSTSQPSVETTTATIEITTATIETASITTTPAGLNTSMGEDINVDSTIMVATTLSLVHPSPACTSVYCTTQSFRKIWE